MVEELSIFVQLKWLALAQFYSSDSYQIMLIYLVSTFNDVLSGCNMGSRWAHDTSCIFWIVNFGICSLCIKASLIRYM